MPPAVDLCLQFGGALSDQSLKMLAIHVQMILRGLPVGDVPVAGTIAHKPARIIPHGDARVLDPADFSILAADPELNESQIVSFRLLAPVGVPYFTVLGHHDAFAKPWVGEKFLPTVAGDPLARRGGVPQRSIAADPVLPVIGEIGNSPIVQFGIPQLALDPPAHPDVHHEICDDPSRDQEEQRNEHHLHAVIFPGGERGMGRRTDSRGSPDENHACDHE